MKILVLSDGTQIQFPDLGEPDATNVDAEGLELVKKCIVEAKYPLTCIPISLDGKHIPLEDRLLGSVFASPSEWFCKRRMVDGVWITPVQKPNSC